MLCASRRKSLHTRLALGIAFAVLASLITGVTTAHPAHAANPWEAEIISTPNTIGNSPFGKQSRRPPGGGGGSGGGGAPVVSYSYHYYLTNYFWSTSSPPVPGSLPSRGVGQAFGIFVRGPVVYYGNRCKANTRWGPYIGVKTTEAGTVYVSGGVADIYQSLSQYTCIDPPHYTDYQVMCGYDVGAEVWGPRNNGYDPPVPYQKLHSEKHLTPFARGGMRDINLCQQSFQVTVRKKLRDLGRYEMKAVGRQIPCTFRDYYTADARTGKVPEDRIIGCDTSRARPYSVQNPKLQIFCPPPYYTRDWSGSWKFNFEECQETREQSRIWQCGPEVSQPPTFDGVSTPDGRYQVLADGKKRLVVWKTPTITGNVRGVTGKKVRFEFMKVQSGPDKGKWGTPYRSDEPHQGKHQLYVADPGLHTRFWDGWTGAKGVPSGMTGVYLAFYKAGYPERPFTVRPVWHFEAKFPIKAVEIQSIDWRTGKMDVRLVDEWVEGSAKCYGKPVQIDVFRARITNVR